MTNYSTSVPQSTPETYQHPWYTQQQLLESTTTSESPSQRKQRPEKVGLTFTDNNRIGDYLENLVQLRAWEKGAEVFPNKGCTGKTDMVLKINGNLYEIDVKSEKFDYKQGTWKSYGKPVPEGVYVVLIRAEDHSIRWSNLKPGSRTPKCPPGLEDFWN